MINKSITYLTFNINRCPVHVTNHGFFLINSRNFTSWSFLRLPKKKCLLCEFNDFMSSKPTKTPTKCRILYNYKEQSNLWNFRILILCMFKIVYDDITVSQKILNFSQIQDNYVHIVSYSFLLRMNISIIYYIVEIIINVCILSSSHPKFHRRNNPRHFTVRILTIPVT